MISSFNKIYLKISSTILLAIFLSLPASLNADGLFSRGPDFEKMRSAVEASILASEEFFSTYTENGIVYFGIRMDGAVKIPKDGLPMGTRPTYGPGCYSTKFKYAIESANSYGRSYGIVVELKFVKAQPRILRFTDQLINDPQYKKLKEKSADTNAALLELAKYFKLDGMVTTGGVVMIFDQDAVAYPKSLADLAAPLIPRIQHEDIPYYRSSELAFEAYKVLYGMAGEEAKKNWASPEAVKDGSAKILLNSQGCARNLVGTDVGAASLPKPSSP